MADSNEAAHPSADSRLAAVAKAIESGDTPPTVTVREFLSWFGAMRRGPWIVGAIRAALDSAGLETSPDFDGAYINGAITFRAKGRAAAAGESDAAGANQALGAEASEADGLVTVGIGDPTYRLGKLAAANKPVVSVAPDRPIADAVTLMLNHDFSQLPVMTGERTVKGMITWRSIGARSVLKTGGEVVADFMDPAHEISADRSIFSALPIIVERDYVLVRDGSQRISGIVTTADLSQQFQQLAEPFLLLGEIENHVRRLMDGKFTKDELAGAKDPDDTERVVESVIDLTFGEHLRLLQEPSQWSKLHLAIDRSMFVKDLDAVRVIRNDVMHFDPDPLPEPELATLRKFAKFLQSLQALGA